MAPETIQNKILLPKSNVFKLYMILAFDLMGQESKNLVTKDILENKNLDQNFNKMVKIMSNALNTHKDYLIHKPNMFKRFMNWIGSIFSSNSLATTYDFKTLTENVLKKNVNQRPNGLQVSATLNQFADYLEDLVKKDRKTKTIV